MNESPKNLFINISNPEGELLMSRGSSSAAGTSRLKNGIEILIIMDKESLLKIKKVINMISFE